MEFSDYRYAIISTKGTLYLVDGPQRYALQQAVEEGDAGFEIHTIYDITSQQLLHFKCYHRQGGNMVVFNAKSIKSIHRWMSKKEIYDARIVDNGYRVLHEIKRVIINPFQDPNFFD